MTTADDRAGRRIDRWSGGCLAVAGVLILPNIAHPDVFDSTFAQAALRTPLWTTIHAALVVSMILSLIGLLGLYARRAEHLGPLGAIGFTLAVVGMVVGACAFYWEAFLLPPIARLHPELFEWNGPVVTNWGVLAGGLGGLWIVGLCLLVVALWRTRALPAPPAVALLASGAAFAVFAGPFVPVLDALATVAFAAAYVWVGTTLWTGATGATGPATGPADRGTVDHGPAAPIPVQGSSRTRGGRRSSSGSR